MIDFRTIRTLLALAATLGSVLPVHATQALTGAVQVSAGGYHACAVTTQGRVMCWGYNAEGQLGDGSATNRLRAVPVMGIAQASAVAAGGASSCAIDGGLVKCWGSNVYGQLGNADYQGNRSATPLTVPGIANATSVVVGWYHACARLADGAVKCWGENTHGQIGNGATSVQVSTPFVAVASGATAIAADARSTCAVLSGGALKCWGQNSNGQLGTGDKVDKLEPTTVIAAGVNQVSLGADHGCAVLSGGALRCWGNNGYGRVGDGSTTERLTPVPILASGVSAISAGRDHSCALVSGAVRCWGSSQAGQVGNGRMSSALVPTGGQVESASAISAGGYFTCAIVAGSVKCWGTNQYGQMGNGVTEQVPQTTTLAAGAGVTQVAASWHHACAVVDGGVRCWGGNNFGELGDGGLAFRTVPVAVHGLPAGSGVTAVATGFEHSCAIVAGAVRCWGANSSGQLGDGGTTHSTIPVAVSGIAAGATSIAAAGFGNTGHTCAVVASAVKCWGVNQNGQLGNGTTTAQAQPVTAIAAGAVAVAAGVRHTCALVDVSQERAETVRQVQCWGDNSDGQVGNVPNSTQTRPATVFAEASIAIAAGDYHTCVVTRGGAVYCWGANFSGQLGDGTQTGHAIPALVSGLSDGVTTIGAGSFHTCASRSIFQSLHCWGDNSTKQVADTDQLLYLTPFGTGTLGASRVAAGSGFTCALIAGGLQCWGANQFGQIGDGTAGWSPQTVTAVFPPGAPTLQRLQPVSQGMRAYFNPPTDTGGSPIEHYQVTCRAENGSNAVVTALGTTSPITVSGLVANETYLCSVHASNADGAGAESVEIARAMRPVSVMPILMLLLE